MKIQETEQPGKIRIDCMECGSMFEVADFREESDIIRQCYEKYRKCPACEERAEEESRRREQETRRAARLAELPRLLEEAGIDSLYCRDRKSGQLFKEPPVRYAAEWIYRNRRKNLLISGVTGSGKTTSACFVAAELIREECRVRYVRLRRLLADWREAKTSETNRASEKLLNDIFHLDCFIIDEVVGKARISESGQELLFELLESVNSGACRARIWLLGNFFSGSIEEIFSDPEPVRRRLQENFSCVLLDKAAKQVKPLTVWCGK